MALQNLFEALVARGPNALLAQQAGEFAKLIGSWSVEVFDEDGDGTKRVSEGEWHFGWVLEGRAIQDVLVVPRREERRPHMPSKGNRYVTSLRFFDPEARALRVFSLDPVSNVFLPLTAQDKEARVIEGRDRGENAIRITLSGITTSAFTAREERAQNGSGWQTVMELRARRVA